MWADGVKSGLKLFSPGLGQRGGYCPAWVTRSGRCEGSSKACAWGKIEERGVVGCSKVLSESQAWDYFLDSESRFQVSVPAPPVLAIPDDSCSRA